MELGAFSISLAVEDLEASRSFYEKFGFKVFAGDASQNWLILKNGDHVTSRWIPTETRFSSISTCEQDGYCAESSMKQRTRVIAAATAFRCGSHPLPPDLSEPLR